MKVVLICALAVAFFSISSGAPASREHDEIDLTESAMKHSPLHHHHHNRTHCIKKCQENSCSCCMKNLWGHQVCMFTTFSPFPLGVEFSLTWGEKNHFKVTATDLHPSPICFKPGKTGKFVKICIDITQISFERGQAGGCFGVTTEPIPIKFTLACLYMGRGPDRQENPRTVKADRVVPAVPLELAIDPKYVMDAIPAIPAVRAMPLRPAQQEDYKSYVDRIPAMPLEPTVQKDPKYVMDAMPGVPAMSLKAVQEEHYESIVDRVQAMPLEPTVQKDPKYVMDAMPGVPAMSLKAVQEEHYESIVDRVQAMPLEPTVQKDPKYVMDAIPAVPAMQMKSSRKEDYDSTVDIAMPQHPSHEKDPEYVMDAIPEVPAMPLKPSQQDDHESVVKLVPHVPFEKENPKLVLKKETLEDSETDASYFSYEDYLNDIVTGPETLYEDGCQCTQKPFPFCYCCSKTEAFKISIKACVVGDLSEADKGFNVTVIANHSLFKEQISVTDPSPICKVVQMLDRKVKMCLKLKKVSLALSNTGTCMDVSIGKLERPLGCFYISK